MSAKWELKPYKVLATVKATVRDPERIFTGWPRLAFAEQPNIPWLYFVAVETPLGIRWVDVGQKRRPRVGSTAKLSTNPNTNAPVGFNHLDRLRECAKLTDLRTAKGFKAT